MAFVGNNDELCPVNADDDDHMICLMKDYSLKDTTVKIVVFIVRESQNFLYDELIALAFDQIIEKRLGKHINLCKTEVRFLEISSSSIHLVRKRVDWELRM